MDKQKLFQQISAAVQEGEMETAGELAQQCLEAGIPPLEAIAEGLTPGIAAIGRLFEAGDAFLPELVAAAEAMKAGLAVLEPVMRQQQVSRDTLGKVVIGTMYNDIHDIGKDMVASMLTAAGFEVVNLGVNVPADTFVGKVRELHPDILGLSALLTTTMPEQQKVIEALGRENLRSGVKVMVGGAPVNRQWADSIGADAFAENAIEAVKAARQLVGRQS